MYPSKYFIKNPKDLNMTSHVCNAWKNDIYMYITPIGVE